MPQLRILSPEADAEAVLAAFEGADDDLLRQAPPILTMADARSYLEHVAPAGWAIEHDGAFAGVVLATNRDTRHRSAWMSYWVAPRHRGLGLAAQSLAAASALLFADGLFRLELGARTNNPASVKTAERAGYLHEGISRAELEYDGVRYDVARMARLATDPPSQFEPSSR